MARQVTEVARFTRDDLAHLAKFAAKQAIIGTLYRGEFQEQQVDWQPDGTLVVYTTHNPEDK